MFWEIIDLSEWKTKETILKELNQKGITIDERVLRHNIEIQNKLFYNHESDVFIAHGQKGYKATMNYDEIKSSANDYNKRALDQLTKYSRILKALGENLNFKLSIDNNSLVLTED